MHQRFGARHLLPEACLFQVFEPHLHAFETSKTLTRVVDQADSFNLGSAPKPSYSSGPSYPSSAGTLTLRFTRDASTRGYFNAGRYTVEKVKVDFQ